MKVRSSYCSASRIRSLISSESRALIRSGPPATLSRPRYSAASEMPFRERTAGAGLEVSLKARGGGFVWKLHRNNDPPWAMLDGVARGSSVVPFEALINVACAANIVSRWIGIASQDVDESGADTAHTLPTVARSGPSPDKGKSE